MNYKTVNTGANPITLQQVKDHLRVIGTEEDSHLTVLSDAAVALAEKYLDYPLVTKNVTVQYDSMMARFDLPLPTETSTKPVITYTDEEGDSQVVPVADYIFNYFATPNYVVFKKDVELPDIEDDSFVTITYTSTGNLHHDVRAAILLIIGHMYENREDAVRSMPTAAEALLRNHRKFRYA